MSLIYHRFPSRGAAVSFASAAALGFERDIAVFESQRDAQQHDPFPYELTPPIVHVERVDGDDREDDLERLAATFGGSFAGT